PSAVPDGVEGLPAEVPSHRFYELDVTITPGPPAGGGFRHWEPGELLLTAPETPWDTDDGACRVERTEVEAPSGFAPDAGLKYLGPRRLRLRLAVRPEVRRLTFRYYTEKFGD